MVGPLVIWIKSSCWSASFRLFSSLWWWDVRRKKKLEKMRTRRKCCVRPMLLGQILYFVRWVATSSRATLSSTILKVRNCGKNWVLTSYTASKISADDVRINYFHHRQSPVCLRSSTRLNFAGKPAINVWDSSCVGDKCSYWSVEERKWKLIWFSVQGQH